jgi:L-lactate dehydrogenase complex protein LldG
VSAARDEVLARVRAAKGGAPAPPAPGYRTAGTLDAAARVALLHDRLVDYRARVERDLRRVLDELGADARIGVPPGLPAAWRPPNAVDDRGMSAAELDRLDGVLTGCTVAIAETGTIVLAGGPAEGRRALTLVPDLHVCVVRSDQVVETVPEAFAALRGLERRPLTFVSGPSATSDIELKRVEGVHGPRRLVVVLVPSQ